MALTEKQQQIVDYGEGAILVKAGPGSGKTRVVIERIKRILKSEKRCKIMALTFSSMAADEMRRRLEEDPEVFDYLDNAYIGTIHAFALEVVQKRGNLIGLDEGITLFENTLDRQKMLYDVIEERVPELKSTIRNEQSPETYLNNLLQLISEQKKKFVSPEMYEGDENFAKLYYEYNHYLREQNALDYDDILFYAYKIFAENAAVQEMYSKLYKYICVDEAQDLNYAQY